MTVDEGSGRVRVLSVDLGTSNTAAVLSAHGRPPRVVEVDGSATMPSAVYADEDGNLVVGRDAERRARLDPSRFEPNPKRRVDDGQLLLGDNVVEVTDALGAVLRRVYEETTRQLGGTSVDEVRLTHPAQWGPVRRNVLLSAARAAGMGPGLSLVPEPAAAAAHFASLSGQTLLPGQSLAVYDLGAGTFDVAVVGATQNGFTVLAEGGLPDLGGLDVDQALLEHVGRHVSFRDPQRWQHMLRPESTADRRTQRALREDVRDGKEALSRHPQTEVPMPEPFDDVLVTRGELEALVRPSLLRSIEVLRSTIRSAGLAAESLAAIYLVGGASRIPLVATLIGEQLRVVPTSLDQPETAVALGAHHVPHEGLSLRTRDLGGTPGGVPVESQAAGSQVTGPPSAGFPAAGATPHTPAAPSPQNYQGYPAQQFSPQHSPAQQVPGRQAGTPATAHGAAHGAQQSAYARQSIRGPAAAASGAAGRDPGRKRRLLVIGAVAAVLLACGGAAAIMFTPPPGYLGADDCAEPGEPDDQGFTSCMRQLAGHVPDTADCRSGNEAAADVPTPNVSNGVTVTCGMNALEGARLVYSHVSSQSQIDSVTRTLELGSGATDVVKANWSGNGLDGRYRAASGSSFAVLVFRATDRPVYGYVLRPNVGAEEISADRLADLFEQNIQPGT